VRQRGAFPTGTLTSTRTRATARRREKRFILIVVAGGNCPSGLMVQRRFSAARDKRSIRSWDLGG
jgi:hypothetical protein